MAQNNNNNNKKTSQQIEISILFYDELINGFLKYKEWYNHFALNSEYN